MSTLTTFHDRPRRCRNADIDRIVIRHPGVVHQTFYKLCFLVNPRPIMAPVLLLLAAVFTCCNGLPTSLVVEQQAAADNVTVETDVLENSFKAEEEGASKNDVAAENADPASLHTDWVSSDEKDMRVFEDLEKAQEDGLDINTLLMGENNTRDARSYSRGVYSHEHRRRSRYYKDDDEDRPVRRDADPDAYKASYEDDEDIYYGYDEEDDDSYAGDHSKSERPREERGGEDPIEDYEEDIEYIVEEEEEEQPQSSNRQRDRRERVQYRREEAVYDGDEYYEDYVEDVYAEPSRDYKQKRPMKEAKKADYPRPITTQYAKKVCNSRYSPKAECYGNTVAYFHDAKTRSCRAFLASSSCIRSSEILFSTLDECLKTCGGYTQPNEELVYKKDDKKDPTKCLLPRSHGNGPFKFHSWHFDIYSYYCKPFEYSGYHGNANHFKSRAECVETCRQYLRGNGPNYQDAPYGQPALPYKPEPAYNPAGRPPSSRLNLRQKEEEEEE